MKNLKVGSILCTILVTTYQAVSFEPAKPNILMILVDDHGYGDLSITGGTDIHTPHLDKLFQKGVQFSNFYSNCTVCSPTRASLMTGRYPDLVGVPGVIRTHETNSWGYLKEDIPTLCEIAGVTINHEIDGMSLVPSILGKNQITNDRTVFFMRREGGIYGGLCYYAARKGKYKLLQNTPYEPFQLFGIVSDPYEKQPLDENSEEFRELKYILSQHIRKSGAIPWQK